MREREKKSLKDVNRISRGIENSLNSYLCYAPFTTTGNRSKQSFDALTVEEGGRRMETEKTSFCSALRKTQ